MRIRLREEPGDTLVGKESVKKQSGSNHKRGKLEAQSSHSEVVNFDLHSVTNNLKIQRVTNNWGFQRLLQMTRLGNHNPELDRNFLFR